MATGELRRPSRRHRRRIDEAVRQAEQTTGLQFCVVLGVPADRDPHEQAEALFSTAIPEGRPAVLVLVAPKHHHVEVLTAPAARQRVSDAAAEVAVGIMVDAFAQGDLTLGLIAGIEHLAASAGPGTAPTGQADIANIVDAED
ncbi:MAG: DUF5130 domain-containing protein [Actinomycetota bacterium]|nr:DUF5130 domain-containing protein [Actinomycetota bacterium]